MGKSNWLFFAIAVLATSFLYETEIQKTISKRSPLEKRNEAEFSTIYKTVGRETATMWKTFTPISAQATRTIVETVTQTVTETTTPPDSETPIPVEAHFQMLYDAIEHRILNRHDVDLIPKYVRASFHDLMNFDGNSHGAEGCILVEPARSFIENKDVVPHLTSLIHEMEDIFLPLGVSFAHADIVSMAGKVAIEMSFQCVRVAWEGGRKNCDPAGFVSSGPPANLDSREKLAPFLVRYGMTDREKAVLTIGSHAVRNSKFVPWIFTSTGQNSGPKFIQETIRLLWGMSDRRPDISMFIKLTI
jgi:hypothetical protein